MPFARVADVYLSDPAAVVVDAGQLYYAVVHGAFGKRQTANGAQPAGAGAQAGHGHGVSPVQQATVDHVQPAAASA